MHVACSGFGTIRYIWNSSCELSSPFSYSSSWTFTSLILMHELFSPGVTPQIRSSSFSLTPNRLYGHNNDRRTSEWSLNLKYSFKTTSEFLLSKNAALKLSGCEVTRASLLTDWLESRGCHEILLRCYRIGTLGWDCSRETLRKESAWETCS